MQIHVAICKFQSFKIEFRHQVKCIFHVAPSRTQKCHEKLNIKISIFFQFCTVQYFIFSMLWKNNSFGTNDGVSEH